MPIWNSDIFKQIKELLPKHHPELLLSYDEYIDTWTQLIESTYTQAMSSEHIAAVLKSNDKASSKFSSASLFTVVVLAVSSWDSIPRVKLDLRVEVANSIADTALSTLAGDAENIEELKTLYSAYLKQFREAVAGVDSKKLDPIKQCAVMARYCVAQGLGENSVDTQEGLAITQELTLAFAQAMGMFNRLVASSVPDGNTLLLRHPRFIVMQG